MRKIAVVVLILAAALASAQSLPTGTAVKMKLENTLTTFSSKAGDPFQARVTEPVVVDGKTVIPVGATVRIKHGDATIAAHVRQSVSDGKSAP